MTKSEELAALAAFISSLPQDTYLKAWLDYALPEISADIRNDIFPTATPSEARRQAMEILSTAKREALSLTQNATLQAERAKKKSDEAIESASAYARRIADAAKQAVENLGTWKTAA